MRILILSDIHGNYEALRTVVSSEKYDHLIFLGDAVDYGPRPAEVLDFLDSNASWNIMGNHDHAVANNVDCQCAPAMHHLSEYSRQNISMKLLSKGDIEKINRFSKDAVAELDGLRIYMTHASPYNNMYGYLFSTEAEMVSRDRNLMEYTHIMVGHTHFPMLYRGRIVNPGSAGQPRDGIWKPWYAVMNTEKESIEFRRFKYDWKKVVDDLRAVIPDDTEEFRQLASYYTPGE